ncbi:hypothetical protein AWB98_10625 [Mycolicibacterium conceptionense]|uniref:Uncharacterized protein n=2 Tax=Mycolicibacterium TaxID=1866885 RepID=A0ABR5FXN6_9MYCO|nr:hypothetical protein AA982_23425 [Mycolicibacterium senegalense]KLO52706.1 hypothetical protein ABW05_15510 [Mycolicibacterium senegalense]ORV27364.1 hypothetical protein AWB98_10625 [Mycolicibacterium conceptionense]
MRVSTLSRTLPGIDDNDSRCASIVPARLFGRPGSFCAPPLLLIVTPGASSLVDDVFPDRFGFAGILAQPLPGPSADVPFLPGELSVEDSAEVGAVEVSPDAEPAEVEVEESEEDVPVVSAPATPYPEARAATSHPVTTMPL